MRINLWNNGNSDKFQPYIDTFLLPGTSTPLGGVLVLPGGGYRHRAAHEADPIAQKFNALGYHAFVLQYRTFPELFPAPQQDLVRAVKIIRAKAAEWRLEKLAVLGFSAGGHLAASGTILADEFAVKQGDETDDFSGQADAMILCYPVISMTDDFAHRGSGDNLFGSEAPDTVRAKLNMHDAIDNTTPPAFLWHSADDQAVPVKNSMEFASKMWACGNSCELHVFPHAPHGKGLGMGHRDLCQWPALAAEFLETTVGFRRG